MSIQRVRLPNALVNLDVYYNRVFEEITPNNESAHLRNQLCNITPFTSEFDIYSKPVTWWTYTKCVKDISKHTGSDEAINVVNSGVEEVHGLSTLVDLTKPKYYELA